MNQQADVVEIVNRLISYGVPGNLMPFSRGFSRSGEGISINPDLEEKYFAAVYELFQANRTVASTYSLKTFEKNVLKFVASYVLSPKEVVKKDVSGFLAELSARPVIRHAVFRPIHQIIKTPGSGPLTLGEFTLYNTKDDAEALNSALRGQMNDVLRPKTEHYLISTTVEARDDLIALEEADALFEQFENALRFMTGPDSNYDARVFGAVGPIPARAILMSEETWSSSSGRENFVKDLDIDDPYFLDPGAGFDKVWASLGNKSSSKLMNKILLAVDWVGQSIYEKVASSAFIKAAIALEVLFTPEKGIFSPSIVAQITENVTLLLGKDEESRVKGEREFKRLYEIRSGIAHAGKTDVERFDLRSIQEMARQVIFKLLTSPALAGCSTPEDLSLSLKALKYRCPTLD